MNKHMPSHSLLTSSPSKRGFTLIELLVVIAVIAILAAILIPVTGSVRRSANSTKCQASLREIGKAVHMFANENKGHIPWANHPDQAKGGQWQITLFPYLSSLKKGELQWMNEKATTLVPTLWACPEYEVVPGQEYSSGYGINVTPQSPQIRRVISKYGYDDDSLPSRYSSFNNLLNITEQEDRILVGDAKNWHIFAAPGEIQAISNATNRHGDDKANYVFFDGHVETLTEAEASIAILDPANR